MKSHTIETRAFAPDALRVYRWTEPVDYAEAYRIQTRLWERNLSGEEPDSLLLLTHPPTFTIGKSGSIENLLVDRDALGEQGMPVFFTDRGGDITYHGPGQLVGYPIVDLRRRGKDIHAYIRDLQEVLIRTLADFSVAAHRDEEHIGVWVGDEKIAAIGVRVRKWVTMHGIALNVNPTMDHFSYINPCGIVDRGVTSLSRLLLREVDMEEVAERFTDRFAEVFAVNAHRMPPERIEVGT
jgi:lipoate-protein ligase B